MIKIKFNDESNMHDVEFRRIDDNIVHIIGLQEINTTGFKTFDSYGEYLGDFSDYTTAYRVMTDGIQYSNDGSEYVEPTTVISATFDGEYPDSVKVITSTNEEIILSGDFSKTVEGDHVYIIMSEYFDAYNTNYDGSTVRYTLKSEEQIRSEKETKMREDKLMKIIDMLTITRESSDKLGYDWEIYTLGNIELRREYIKNDNHSGTLEDPIPFELGLSLIPNAYYSYDGHLYVYMGQATSANTYPADDTNGWVLWE